MKKRILSLLLAITLVIGIFPITAFAASTTYITIKDDVQIWSSYSSSSTKKYVIADTGTTITVTGSRMNSSFNWWYQLNDGNWVYSGNVEKHTSHSYSGGICTGCGYEWPYSISSMSSTTYIVTNKDGASIWSRPYSNNSTKKSTASYGSTMTIVGKTTNEDGNLWYKTSSGTWVYSGNVEKHTSHDYEGLGVCADCGYTYPLVTTTVSNVKYEVTDKDGANLYSSAYSASTKKSTVAYGDILTITASTVNAYGNVWFKTSAGYWIYSDHVEKTSSSSTFTVSYNANGGTSAPSSSNISSGGSLTTSKPTRDGYTFLGWSTSKTATTATYKAGGTYNGTANVTLYAVWEKNSTTCTTHSYTGEGVCEDCDYTYPITTTSMSNTSYVVTNTDGASIYDNAYSSATKKSTASYGSLLTIVASTKNAYGNTWYKTSSGTWVYSGNVEKHTSHSYTGEGVCEDCGYTYPLVITTLDNVSYKVTNTNGADIYKNAYSSSTGIACMSYGAVLTMVATTVNAYGNTWYKTSTGYWIYSGNVEEMESAFTVTYNSNGGSYGPSSDVISSGDSLSTITPLRDGYTFLGWSTSKSATSATYKSGDTYKGSSDVTLYAVWSKIVCDSHSYVDEGECEICGYEYIIVETPLKSLEYIVTNTSGANLYKNAYSSSTKKTTESYGEVLTIVAMTVNAYENLWYKTSDGYWVYSENIESLDSAFTVTYNANGGTSTPSSSKISYGDILTTSKPTRDGYTFLGWSTSKSATSATYKSGGTYNGYTDVTLYAVWQVATVTCTTHSYTSASGNFCTVCGYEYEPTYTKVNDTYYSMYDDVSIRYTPYADSGEVTGYLDLGESIYISYVFENSLGNTWYKTKDGFYVYSEYFTNDANYNFETQDSTTDFGYVEVTKPTVFSTTEKNVTVYDDYSKLTYGSHTLSSAGTLVTIISSEIQWGNGNVEYGETINGTWIKMSELQEIDLQPPITGLYIVTTNDTPLRNEASSSATIKTTVNKGEQIRIVDTFYNDQGNPWGETSDGYVVYMGNLEYTQDSLVIKVNDDVLELSAKAYTSNGSTMIPIRDIAEALGAYVEWDESTNCVIIQRGLDTAVLQINDNKLYGSEIISLNSSAVLINDKTYVPLRAVSEIFGATVDWVEDTNTVKITYEAPSEDEVLDAFVMFNFNHFSSYTASFVNENMNLSTALSYSLSSIGEYSQEVILQTAKNLSGISFVQYVLGDGSAYDYDISDSILKSNLSDIIDEIVLIDGQYYDFSTYGEASDYISDYLKATQKGIKYVGDGDDASKYVGESLDLINDIVDIVDFSVEMLEYLVNDYDRQMRYLDLLEELYDPASKGQQEVFDDLREEYSKSYVEIVEKVYDKVMDETFGIAAKATSSLFVFSVALVEATTDVLGLEKSSTNTLNASVGLILSGGLVSNYSTLYNDTRNNSYLPSTKTTQKAWNEIVLNYISAKGATIYMYESMHDATSDKPLQLYLEVQANVLELIQINTDISTARKTPYYLEEFTSLLDN